MRRRGILRRIKGKDKRYILIFRLLWRGFRIFKNLELDLKAPLIMDSLPNLFSVHSSTFPYVHLRVEKFKFSIFFFSYFLETIFVERVYSWWVAPLLIPNQSRLQSPLLRTSSPLLPTLGPHLRPPWKLVLRTSLQPHLPKRWPSSHKSFLFFVGKEIAPIPMHLWTIFGMGFGQIILATLTALIIHPVRSSTPILKPLSLLSNRIFHSFLLNFRLWQWDGIFGLTLCSFLEGSKILWSLKRFFNHLVESQFTMASLQRIHSSSKITISRVAGPGLALTNTFLIEPDFACLILQVQFSRLWENEKSRMYFLCVFCVTTLPQNILISPFVGLLVSCLLSFSGLSWASWDGRIFKWYYASDYWTRTCHYAFSKRSTQSLWSNSES